MIKRCTIRKVRGFREAERIDREEDAGMTPAERLELVQILREEYNKFARDDSRETGKRLRRVTRIVQRA